MIQELVEPGGSWDGQVVNLFKREHQRIRAASRAQKSCKSDMGKEEEEHMPG